MILLTLLMRYNKLVRDKIPEIIKRKGQTPVTHVATVEEFSTKLKEKLSEEVAEFQEAESIEELADVLEVIDTIIVFRHFEKNQILEVQKKKRKERGGFEKRIILDEA